MPDETKFEHVAETAERARKEEEGQGLSEYAILVGVIVAVAVLAVILFGDYLGNLWDGINEQMQAVLTNVTP